MEKEGEVRDPVCNMACDEKTSTKVTYGGKTYHFCSDSCRRAFEQNPEEYAKGSRFRGEPLPD